ncbi:hypothetical protein SNE40_010447 [Patella caerulea]|uniref:Uncharacterized protein n=1 Tax=Patella caerulea TaxID=87958 RepID=A0AAN8K121_PATCE
MGLPKERLFLVIRTALYALIFLLGMFIFSPLSLQMNVHDGNCILYAERNSDYPSKSNCNFCIAIGVLFCFIYGGLMTIIGALRLLEIISDSEKFKGVLFIVNVVVDAVSMFLVLVTASILSAGLKAVCDSFTPVGYHCRDIFLIVNSSGEHDTFYNNLAIAEGGAWICFIAWIVQTVLGVFIMYRNNIIRIPCLKNSSSTDIPGPSADGNKY